mmetsp:Transcript_131150/g.311064  ORF Transcript_131150/g.311064 Transcript_131150/m.311064 type:complete len:292 (-) Transcript_131150:169-1044(-)
MMIWFVSLTSRTASQPLVPAAPALLGLGEALGPGLEPVLAVEGTSGGVLVILAAPLQAILADVSGSLAAVIVLINAALVLTLAAEVLLGGRPALLPIPVPRRAVELSKCLTSQAPLVAAPALLCRRPNAIEVAGVFADAVEVQHVLAEAFVRPGLLCGRVNVVVARSVLPVVSIAIPQRQRSVEIQWRLVWAADAFDDAAEFELLVVPGAGVSFAAIVRGVLVLDPTADATVATMATIAGDAILRGKPQPAKLRLVLGPHLRIAMSTVVAVAHLPTRRWHHAVAEVVVTIV